MDQYFSTGDKVEVSSKQEGFNGSYFEATLLAKVPSRNEYVVEYKTLVEDDMKTPLTEFVTESEVRPVPPSVKRGRVFKLRDRVDAFDNDGWWVGTICGMSGNDDKYYVYFEHFKVGLIYHVSRLRMHRDWDNGRWSLPSRKLVS